MRAEMIFEPGPVPLIPSGLIGRRLPGSLLDRVRGFFGIRRAVRYPEAVIHGILRAALTRCVVSRARKAHATTFQTRRRKLTLQKLLFRTCTPRYHRDRL